MFKRNVKWFFIIGVLSIALFFFFHPILFKKAYIEKNLKVELPDSAKVVDYKFNGDLYYAKVEIDKEMYDSFMGDIYTKRNEVASKNGYVHNIINSEFSTINFEVVNNFKCGEMMRNQFCLVSYTTREIIYIITAENTGRYYYYYCF